MKLNMRWMWVFWIPITLGSQTDLRFEDVFIDKTLRIDFYQIGNAKEEFVTIDRVCEEGPWSGNPLSLIDPFGYGRYRVQLIDPVSNRLVYSRGFDAYLGEYRTTEPAIQGVRRTYHRSVRVPCPKRSVVFVLQTRDRQNLYNTLYVQSIDPSDYHIVKESLPNLDMVYQTVKGGDPKMSVDLVLIGEGYTAEQWQTFKSDVDRYTGLLFGFEPYKDWKNRFNIYTILRPSQESGMDEPRQKHGKNTTLDCSFNALDLDRYMLTENNLEWREIASQVPYDVAVILVNSERYGGGGIYNDFCTTTVNHALSPKVFIHEFGHNFAGLADEYYTSDVAYNEFYPKGVEPVDPNITALLDPLRLKWSHLVAPGTGIPTEWGKERIEALQKEMWDCRRGEDGELARLREQGADENKIRRTETRWKAKIDALQAKVADVRSQYAHLAGKVGAFEGAGYASKDMYRPMLECLMFSNEGDTFCAVCRDAIERMIRFYTGGEKP